MILTSFRSRLIAILLFINICVLSLGASAYWALGALDSRIAEFTGGMYAQLEIIGRLQSAAATRAIAVRNLALRPRSDAAGAWLEEFERQHEATHLALKALQASVANKNTPASVKTHVESIARLESVYGPVAESIVAQLRRGEHEAAVTQIETVCTPALTALNQALKAYTLLAEQRARAYIQDSAAATHAQRWALLSYAVLTGLCSAGLGYLLRCQIRRALGAEPERLNNLLGRLAAGDLAAVGSLEAPQAGSLLAAMHAMQHQMADVVVGVRAASQRVAAGSAEMAAAHTDLNQRTQAQMHALRNTSAAMEQLSGSVHSNTDSARLAEQLAQRAAQVATQGGQHVEHVVSTMQTLCDSGRRIADITGVIDAIAFQTNILALNAAVEAARAGPHGRGFAVVAAEVRVLAARCAEAAREIKALIGRNVDQTEQGAAVANRAGDTMRDIVTHIHRVSDLVADIAAATALQSSGIHLVDDAVTAMDQVTQQNAALVEQGVAASETLRLESDQLVRAVASFRLTTTSPTV